MGKGSSKADRIIMQYSIVQEVQKYEGEGIWGRFNIMLSTNTILMAAIGFFYSSKPSYWSVLVLVTSIGGLLHSFWALYVLRRLWLWHGHWKEVLVNIEARFPDYLEKPLTCRPVYLRRSRNGRWSSLFLAYTQPFIIVMSLIWLTMIILSIAST